MDARLDLFALLGLEIGDAHIIRNAGGIVTDDVVRSLLISQRKLGTTDVIVIQHTGCGLLDLDTDALAGELEAETGRRPGFELGSFQDVDASVRASVEHLRVRAVPAPPGVGAGLRVRGGDRPAARGAVSQAGSRSTSGISRSVFFW